jgi:hypothetical protein
MTVGIEGRRERIVVVHGFRGFSHYGNSSWFRVFHTWVRWIARTTSSRYKTKGDGSGGGGVCWIPRSTSSRDKMRGMGQEGVGYSGHKTRGMGQEGVGYDG